MTPTWVAWMVIGSLLVFVGGFATGLVAMLLYIFDFDRELQG